VSDSYGIHLVRLTRRIGQPAAESGGDRKGHSRLLPHEIEERTAVQAQNLAVGLGLDGSGPRAVSEKRHFPKWFAGMKDLHRRVSCRTTASMVDAY
jgi:hypothetical protein